uniref:Integrase catalytic domain-containing protein n=1 Tax=Fagus sylvatica TaxID=28930 RepID=A0A2N9EV74_FAGSY
MFDMIKALQVSQNEVVGMIKELRDKKNSRSHRKPPEGEGSAGTRRFARRQPYPAGLLNQPYPDKYEVPTFTQYDGRKGNATEHVNKFLNAMGPHAGNGNLCLREFSKSLTDRAYTWYITLKPDSVRTWDDMVEVFCTKYFHVEDKITLLTLHNTKQGPTEGLLPYIKRFKDVALDWYGNHEESELVGICITNMVTEYRAHLENLDIVRFTALLQKARKTALSVKAQLKSQREVANRFWQCPHNLIRRERDKKISRKKSFCLSRDFAKDVSNQDKGWDSRVVQIIARDMDKEEIVPSESTIMALQKSPKFRSLFDQLGLGAEARKMATAALVSIAAESGAQCFTVEAHASRAYLETTNAISFTNEDIEVQYSDHKRPLYLTASINEVIGFEGAAEYTIGHIQLALKVGPILSLTHFHVIDSAVSYHVLLGCPWLHKHKLVSSTYHQCMKGRLNGKPIRIPVNNTPFDETEVHFVEAAFYEDLALAEESSTSRTMGMPLPAWEDIRDHPEADLKNMLELKRKLKEAIRETQDQRPKCGHPSCCAIQEAVHNPNEGSMEEPREEVDYQPSLATEDLEVINLSDNPEIQRPISISASLSAGERTSLLKLLKEYQDVFAWQYDQMLSLDSGLVAHALNVEPGTRPVVQPKRTLHPEVEAQITKEIQKLLAAGCCVDFRNLNKACPKDKFPLPSMDVLIDSAVGHEMFSFMEDFSGYNQLYLASNNQAIGALIAQDDEQGQEQPVYYVIRALKETETRYSRAERVCLALVFDGFSVITKGGAGIVLSREGHQTIAMSFKLGFPYSNNVAEYKAYLIGLAIAHEMGIKCLKVIGDSNLVVSQANGNFSLKEPSLAPYRTLAQKLEEKFNALTIEYTHRSENRYTDALAALGSQVAFEGASTDVTIIKRDTPITDTLEQKLVEPPLNENDWRNPIKEALINGYCAAGSTTAGDVLAESANGTGSDMAAAGSNKKSLKVLKDYTLIGDQLYIRLPRGMLARCLGEKEATKRLLDVHAKTCGHGKSISLYRRLQRISYYWPSMRQETATIQGACPTCQNEFEDKQVYAVSVAEDWRMPFFEYLFQGILQEARGEAYKFKRQALRYFAEGSSLFKKGLTGEPLRPSPLKKAIGLAVANFIREHIICRFGIPHKIVTDNGTPFINKDVRAMTKHYRVKHLKSSPYYPQEAIAPIEIAIPTPRVIQGTENDVDASMCAKLRTCDLEALKEVRNQVLEKTRRYHLKMVGAYGKIVKERIFVTGQLVLKAADYVRRGLPSPSKFASNWEGPYVIHEAHVSGYYKLSKADGTVLVDPVNGKWLKHYYA